MFQSGQMVVTVSVSVTVTINKLKLHLKTKSCVNVPPPCKCLDTFSVFFHSEELIPALWYL